MKKRVFAILGSLMITGCLASPHLNSPNLQSSVVSNARYQLQALLPNSATITSVTASSTKNVYFPASYVIDTNPSSAWAPLDTDTNPTLVFTLDKTLLINAVAIKASHQNGDLTAITVDVAVSTDNGATFSTIATGLTPTLGALSSLAVGPGLANVVKLTFQTSDLYVCDVDLLGDVPPSASPTPTDCCDTTGGGYVLGNPALGQVNNNEISFGFVAHHIGATNEKVQGEIEVVDHRPDGKKYHGKVNAIQCNGDIVTFSGDLKDGGTFTCQVQDKGEPGNDDTFAFNTSSGFAISGDLGGPLPGGGNIQVRACSKD